MAGFLPASGPASEERSLCLQLVFPLEVRWKSRQEFGKLSVTLKTLNSLISGSRHSWPVCLAITRERCTEEMCFSLGKYGQKGLDPLTSEFGAFQGRCQNGTHFFMRLRDRTGRSFCENLGFPVSKPGMLRVNSLCLNCEMKTSES